MTELIGRILEKAGGEAMVFPTVWEPLQNCLVHVSLRGRHGSAVHGALQGRSRFRAGGREDPRRYPGQTWTRDYLELGSSGIYYSGQFSEPQRFDGETWEKLVKPSDLAVLGVTKEFAEKYNIVHICGEAEFGFQSSPAPLCGVSRRSV